jgi:hypothetical protein
MKKVLLTLLVMVVVLGVVGAAGVAGYRFGYAQGVQATANGEAPNLRPLDRIGPGRMPLDHFGRDRGFGRGFGMRGFPMMGFGVFSLLRFVIQIAVLGLIVWLAYWLFTRSGWRLTRETAETTQRTQTTQTTESAPPDTENE